MPDINVLPQPVDTGVASAGPEALAQTPGALAARSFVASMNPPGRGLLASAALKVSASDIRAFDDALAGADDADAEDAAQALPGMAPAPLEPMASGTAGSMAEMTAALGVYRSANATPRLSADASTVTEPLPSSGAMPPMDPTPQLSVNPTAPAVATPTGERVIEPTPQATLAATLQPASPLTQALALNPTAPATLAVTPPPAVAAPLGEPLIAPKTQTILAATPPSADGKYRQEVSGDDEDTASSGEEVASVPGAGLDAALPVVPSVPAAPAPAVAVAATSQSLPSQGLASSRLDVATIVQQVTRTLAQRDLQALDAGREVVLRLDEGLLPQTVLSFKPVAVSAVTVAAAAAATSSPDGVPAAPQVLVSIETRSDEVRAFLDNHGQALIDAMSREAPGLHWVRGAANSWLDRSAAVPADVSLTLAAAASVDATQGAVAAASASTSASQDGTSRDREADSASQGDRGGWGSQERGSSSGQGQQGQGEGRSPWASSAADEAAQALARVADRWAGLSDAARQQATNAFTDAVDGRP